MKKVIIGVALVLILGTSTAVTATLTAPEAPQVVLNYGIGSLGLSSADVRALEWDADTAEGWIDNAVSEKVRRTKERMAIATLQDPSGMLPSYRANVAEMLSGIIITCGSDIPANVQDYIVTNSNLLSARDRTQLALQEQQELFPEPATPTPEPTPTPREI